MDILAGRGGAILFTTNGDGREYTFPKHLMYHLNARRLSKLFCDAGIFIDQTNT